MSTLDRCTEIGFNLTLTLALIVIIIYDIAISLNAGVIVSYCKSLITNTLFIATHRVHCVVMTVFISQAH